jgi:predicted anti-sigma-YlaC factor YlaD
MELDITCQEIKQQLSAYLDGELDRAVCAEIERHLSGCENCRVLVDTLNRTILLYREYGPTAVPSGAHARLIRILDLKKMHA